MPAPEDMTPPAPEPARRPRVLTGTRIIMLALVVVAAGLCAGKGVMLYHESPTYKQQLDERDLARLMQAVKDAPVVATAATVPHALVQSVFPTEQLRDGGHVRVIKSGTHSDLIIDQTPVESCKTFVRKGFTPAPMAAPQLWINGAMHPIPGDVDVLCAEKPGSGLTLAWRMP